MNLQIDVITTIEKEVIEKLHFPENEVLDLPEEKAKRRYDAERAMKLGNSFKDKVKIVFEDAEGIKMAETTIWGVTEKMLLLKRGMMIPLHRVHEIVI